MSVQIGSIEDFTPETKANEFAPAVQLLIEAGAGKVLPVTVPRGEKRDGTPGNGVRDRVLFQKAANDAGYTAKVVDEVINEDEGTVTLKFTLTQKHNRGGARKAKDETPAEAPAEDVVETPAEAEAEAETPSDAPSRKRR